jgi:hypothetical protein
MSEIVFILGAGASREAGAPLMNDFLDVAYDIKKRLPDHADTLKDFNLVFKGIAALEASVAKANVDLQNVESVFAAFEMAKLLGRLGSLSNEEINSLPTAMTGEEKRGQAVFLTIQSRQLPTASASFHGLI